MVDWSVPQIIWQRSYSENVHVCCVGNDSTTPRSLSLPLRSHSRPRFPMPITELVFGPASKPFQTNPADPTLVKPSYDRILKQEGAIK